MSNSKYQRLCVLCSRISAMMGCEKQKRKGEYFMTTSKKSPKLLKEIRSDKGGNWSLFAMISTQRAVIFLPVNFLFETVEVEPAFVQAAPALTAASAVIPVITARTRVRTMAIRFIAKLWQ